MAKVGVLAVSVVANTQQFQKGLNGAGKEAQTFGGKVTKFLSSPMGVLAAATGVATAGLKAFKAMLALGRELDPIGKMADNLGIAAEELQRLQFAAEQTGAGNVAGAIEKMTNAVGEANQGLSTQVKAFEMIRVNFETLRNLRPDEQFLEIADAIQQMTNKTDQITAMRDIFGRSGGGFINLLSKGREGVAALGDELERAGGIISRTDIAKFEKLNDSINLLKKGFRALKAELLAPIAESFAESAGKFAKAAGLMRKNFEALAEKLAKESPALEIGAELNKQLNIFDPEFLPGLLVEQDEFLKRLESNAKPLELEIAPLGAGEGPDPANQAAIRQQQIMDLNQLDIGKSFEAVAVEGEKVANTFKMMNRESPFSQTITRGSQQDLRMRFQVNHDKAMEKMAREALDKADRRDALLADLAARSGVDVMEFAF